MRHLQHADDMSVFLGSSHRKPNSSFCYLAVFDLFHVQFSSKANNEVYFLFDFFF